MRLSQEEIAKKVKELKCTTQGSWSKISTYRNDLYGYLLKYILRVPEDKPSNAYSYFGGASHDLLEKFYLGEMTNREMVESFERYIALQTGSDIKFNSKDEEKDESIAKRYTENVKHYLYNCRVEWCSKLESFGYTKIRDWFMFGYIDKIHMQDGSVVITDFKTSTRYSNSAIQENKGQLLLYALFYYRTMGVPPSCIKCCWDFLKYCTVEYQQMKGDTKETHVERIELVDKLSTKIKSWMKKLKYTDEQIEFYLDKVRERHEAYDDLNCFDELPEDVRSKFKVKDCVIYIDVNKEELENFEDEVGKLIDEINSKTDAYNFTKDDSLFWTEINASNSFYFNNLCGYSSKLHKPLKEYFDSLETFEGEDMGDEIFKQLFS